MQAGDAVKKKQKRRGTLSVSAAFYAKLEAYAKATGQPVSQIVEQVLRPVIGAVELPEPSEGDPP